MGIDFIILCLTTMNGFHIKGVTENKGDVFLCTEICNPISGKYTLNTDNDVFAVLSNCIEKGFPGTTNVFVSYDLTK